MLLPSRSTSGPSTQVASGWTRSFSATSYAITRPSGVSSLIESPSCIRSRSANGAPKPVRCPAMAMLPAAPGLVVSVYHPGPRVSADVLVPEATNNSSTSALGPRPDHDNFATAEPLGHEFFKRCWWRSNVALEERFRPVAASSGVLSTTSGASVASETRPCADFLTFTVLGPLLMVSVTFEEADEVPWPDTCKRTGVYTDCGPCVGATTVGTAVGDGYGIGGFEYPGIMEKVGLGVGVAVAVGVGVGVPVAVGVAVAVADGVGVTTGFGGTRYVGVTVNVGCGYGVGVGVPVTVGVGVGSGEGTTYFCLTG